MYILLLFFDETIIQGGGHVAEPCISPGLRFLLISCVTVAGHDIAGLGSSLITSFKPASCVILKAVKKSHTSK